MIYRLEAYGYSDFEVEILSHEKSFTHEELKDICDEVKRIIRRQGYQDDYFRDFLHILVDRFGFDWPDLPCIDIGCSLKDEVTIWHQEDL